MFVDGTGWLTAGACGAVADGTVRPARALASFLVSIPPQLHWLCLRPLIDLEMPIGRSVSELEEQAERPSVKMIAKIRTKSSFVPQICFVWF